MDPNLNTQPFHKVPVLDIPEIDAEPDGDALPEDEDVNGSPPSKTPSDEQGAPADSQTLSFPDGPDEDLQATGHAQEHEPPIKPTILVVHASVGSGHRSAAMATAQALEILRDTDNPDLLQGLEIPKDLDVEVIDILDFGRHVFDGNKAASLFTGATRPIYDITWRYTLTGRLLWGGGTIWSHFMYKPFTTYIEKTKPLAVICTHITAANSAVAARMLTGLDFPIVGVPTDYETEGLWPHRGIDLFCVATESMAETLRPRGIPDEKILITGIPTRDDFRKTYDKQATREELGLPQDKLVVLALAGAYLPRPYVHFRETLDKMLAYLHTYPDMHFVFVAGADKQYAEHVKAECRDLGLTNITVLGYVNKMAALMAASDLAICKSGGLTVTECLCAQVPMILLGRAYGQEKVNTQMLTAMGAAMHVTTARELVAALRHISRHPNSVKAMLINGECLRYPEAALDVSRATLRLIDEVQAGMPLRKKKHFLWFYWGKKPAHIR